MKILTRKEIEQAISIPAILEGVEEGFLAYSRGETVIPLPAVLHFDDPHGDCHIKYGYAKNGNYYVVKVASGFAENAKLGLPTGNGLMLLFDKKTGELLALLQDEGYLTDLRTAIAGAIAAKYLAPKNISSIGIVGTGAQAYYQLQQLAPITSCRRVMVWGRDKAKAQKYQENLAGSEWSCRVAENLDELASNCNLIVTTTSATSPLLFASQIRPGTHITAVGADDIGKQELDPMLFAKADIVAVDSRSQCSQFGDVSYALKSGIISETKMVELGEIIRGPQMARTSEAQITVADLTGVAIQDLQIAKAIYEISLQNL